VTGKVANGLHSGDIRYFLLPVPADGSVIGTPDGDTLTAAQVSQLYSNSADVLKSLQRLNYKDGATRRYQTADGKYHVWSRILHFAAADAAQAWALGDKPKPEWTEFAIPGYPDEKGYDISSVDATTGEARLRAVGFRGDVFFEVDVFGEPPVDHTVLVDRVRKQIARLDTGS
jgi:hypothetical protein